MFVSEDRHRRSSSLNRYVYCLKMIEDIYNESAEEFIRQHISDSPDRLRFAMHGKQPGFDVNLAITQIEATRKCKSKIPFFLAHKSFIIPDTSLAEQASNQYISLFHTFLIGKDKSVIDLTAGLGIDAFTMALTGNRVSAIEMNPSRAMILKHNSKVLDINDITVYEDEAMKWLSDNPSARFNYIFIDPARRTESNVRSFLLEDSSPDTVTHQQLLLNHADDVLIKASPLLDISKTISDFTNVKNIYVVSFKGECKEVLIHLNRLASSQDAAINVIDIIGADRFDPRDLRINYSFIVSYSGMSAGKADYAESDEIKPGKYMYEPGAGIRKLQCESVLMDRFPGLKSLSRKSNIYISDTLYSGFPGRISTIESVPEGKGLQQVLKGAALRVVSSDYPLSVEALRKKYKIKEGDSNSIIFSRLYSGKYLAILTSSMQPIEI